MQNSDIQMFLSQEMSDALTNGGRMDQTAQVISGVVQNVWPHVPKADRDSGKTQDRKVHLANRNSSNEPLLSAMVIYDGDTLGADWAFFFPVSHDAVQDDWDSGGPEEPSRMFVSGTLKTAIGPTDTVATVVFADASQASHILDTDYVYISDKSDPDSGTGNAVTKIISGNPSVSSNEATFTMDAAVGYSFAADTTKICVGYMPGVDIFPDVTKNSETVAGAGTLDETQITFDNKGTIKQVVTLSFSDSAVFTVSSDEPGVTLAAGNITVEYSPTNPVTGTPYFTIPIAAWTSGFANLDEIELEFDPSTIPQVQRRVVPSSCPSLANNRLRVVLVGESQT